MSDLVAEAKLIALNNKTQQAHRDFMTKEQREAFAEDFASRKEFLSASHFTTDAEKRKEFERLFWENIMPKGN